MASVPSVAGLVFPRAVKTFADRHPGMKIEMRDADSGQVIDALIRGQADIGIASTRLAVNGVRRTPLFSDRFGLVCAPSHPLARREAPPTIREAVSSGFIANDLCRSIKAPGFQEAIAEAALSARNTLSLIAMVRSGAWVTVLPQAVVHIAPSDVVFREIADLPDRRRVDLLIREKGPFARLAEEFGEIIAGTDWPLTRGAGADAG